MSNKQNDPATQCAECVPPPLFRLGPKGKKLLPLHPWQAYAILYCKKNCPLSVLLHKEHKELMAGGGAAIAKYSHLLSELECESPSSIRWLPFFQRVMSELVSRATKEQLKAVESYIKKRLEKDLLVWEHLWQAFAGGEHESEAARKKKYIAR